MLADEPTTALDVTIQAQILELMKELQKTHGTAIILVTHDLGVVAGMSDRVNVMYAGKLVETASAGPLFHEPRHPYTKGLLASVPRLTGDPNAELESIPGSPPDLAAMPPGCAFEPRCSYRKDHCSRDVPPLLELPTRDTARSSACFENARLAGTDGQSGRPSGGHLA